MTIADTLRRFVVKLAALAGVSAKVPAAEAQERPLRLPLAPTPENATALAARAVQAVRDLDRVELDFTPESLKHIDRIVLRFHSQGLRFNDVGETAFVFGCYVGEVIVRHLNARWEMPDEQGRKLGFTMMGVTLPDGSFMNPIGKTFKLLKNGSEDSVLYFYQAIEALKK